MRKTKLIKILILSIFLLLPCTITKAGELFTTPDGIKVEKQINGFTKGSIELDISNISLSSEGNYTWTLCETTAEKDIKKWYVLGDINASKKTAKINLSVQEKEILNILRKTNTAYLYIKEQKENAMIVNKLELDLTLPPLYAFDCTEEWDSYYITGGDLSSVDQWKGATYNIKNVFYKFDKITDNNLINKYNEAKNNNTSLQEVFKMTTKQVEQIENWTSCSRDSSYPITKIDKEKIPKEQGIYYLYLKGKDVDSKTVYGCLIIEIDKECPKVEYIRVESPAEGTYKTGQTVEIEVKFTKNIKGEEIPTLKIKFGNSPIRTISNGTIKNYTGLTHGYITYKYNIQKDDIGQIQTVDLSGGNIEDEKGNKAVLTCPLITGNVIKANTNGTITNETENQDKHNNEQNNNNKPSNNNTPNTNNQNQNNGSTNNDSNKKENQTIINKLPFAGKSIGIILAIIGITGLSVLSYIKFNKLKGI